MTQLPPHPGPIGAAGITGEPPLTKATLDQIWRKLCESGEHLPDVEVAELNSRQPQPVDEPFIWETNDGVCLCVRDMASPHLFFALRMIFNHSVPPAFRIGEFRRRHSVPEWPTEYRAQACEAFTAELKRRNDLEPVLQHQFEDLLANREFLEHWCNIMGPMGEPGISEDALRKVLDEYSGPQGGGDVVDLYGTQNDAPVMFHVIQAAPPTPIEVSGAQGGPAPLGPQSHLSPARTASLRRLQAKEKRMKRAVPTTEPGFPGVRCMEHRSYAGIRKPRVDCKACKQVYRARPEWRKGYRKV